MCQVDSNLLLARTKTFAAVVGTVSAPTSPHRHRVQTYPPDRRQLSERQAYQHRLHSAPINNNDIKFVDLNYATVTRGGDVPFDAKVRR